jgi:tRNA dimethylallyltransferase
MKRGIVIITGATATGKSDFAEHLALQCDGVIINGDMGQMYTPLSIGTAKPAWRTSLVPHYLFDIIDEPRNSSSLEFRSQVEAVLENLPPDKLPIVVGGSLFHLSTLFYKPQGPRVASALEKDDWLTLQAIDPHRAALLHPHDTYRVHRALAIAEHTLPSQCAPIFMPVKNQSTIINVTQPRDILYKRINMRVGRMLNEGWLDEVQLLDKTWHSWLLAKKIIGYDTIVHELQKDAGINCLSTEGVALIQQRTRNYAKRQITFWRSFSEKIRQEPKISLTTYDGSIHSSHENFLKTLHIP